MPGRNKCEVGCTCGHHPDGMLPPEEWTKRQRSRERARVRHPRTPEQVRRYQLRNAHGMTPEEWDAMWAAQSGRCCYCNDPLPQDRSQVHIDHDHACCAPKRSCVLCRRGLACQNCNFVVGNALDDPDRLELIAANLRKLKAMTAMPGEITAGTAPPLTRRYNAAVTGSAANPSPLLTDAVPGGFSKGVTGSITE